MKKILKSIGSVFRKPLFGIVCLVLSAVLYVLNTVLGVFDTYGNNGFANLEFITYADYRDGYYYILDYADSQKTAVIRFEEGSNTADLVLTPHDLGYENASIESFCTDENGNIYLTLLAESENAQQTNVVLSYSPIDKSTRTLYTCSSVYCIGGLNASDGQLRFMKYDWNDTILSMEIDMSDLSENVAYTYTTEESDTLLYISYGGDGNYYLQTYASELYRLEDDETATLIYTPDFDISDYLNTECFTSTPVSVDGKLYIVGGFVSSRIYEISDGMCSIAEQSEIFKDITCEQLLSDLDTFANAKTYSYVFSLGGRLAYSSIDKLTIIEKDGTETEITDIVLPLKNRVFDKLDNIAAILAAVLFALGIISVVGCIMHWRFSLLSKMLWLMIPVIVLMILCYILIMTNSIKETYYKNTKNQIMAVCDLGSTLFDGDELAEMTDFSIVEDGSYNELYNSLLTVVGNNLSDWNDNMTANIYACPDEKLWLSIDSDFSLPPFSSVFFAGLTDPSEIERFENTETYIKPIYYTDETEPYAISGFTPIYDSDGNTAAILVISSDLGVMNEEIRQMQLNSVLTGLVFIVLLIISEAISAFYIVRNLRNAGKIIAGIADGDFEKRIVRTTKDELGEICSGVNNMAVQLQLLFTEKDKNEQFYYKFVPEQFRELLHKESFTDLSLGDAESADLTVLFCDIRSFSLNSEMMTAKENFEFVNTIYGKAGPVVRRNGGFVDKYIGDAVMALFENADDAVRAGMELYRDIVLDTKTAEELGVSSINIGIGIHSGMARIGIVGEKERMSGTVISNTVNLSSRLESLTKQYNTAMIITKDTLDRMSDPDALNTRYLGMIQVAGVNEVKALYEVLDALDDDRRVPRTENKYDFREAVKLFHLGKSEEALAMFEKLRENDSGEDIALDKYIGYIKEHIESGDRDHNVFRFSRK